MVGPRTFLYVDAFNLYFGAVKGTPYRWLDLARLCQLLLPTNDIIRIRYFTARVKARPHDPNQPVRQQMYLRALRTIPNLSIHYGHFLTHVVKMPLADSPPGDLRYVEVIKTEEKGSDVNLATHLLNDAYKNRYDAAVIISNDSDLVEPVKVVTTQMGKAVGVLNPHPHPSRDLLEHATFFKTIRRSTLAKSQFPHTLADKHGTFHKPSTW